MSSGWPNLVKIIEMMYSDSLGTMYDPMETKWSWPAGIDLNLLERQASLLGEEDMETVAAGEESEVEELVTTLNIRELHNFLNEVFDGDHSHLLVPGVRNPFRDAE